MAVEAPVHVESIDTPSERHLIDAAVTGGAANAFVDVDAMIEVNESRQIVHARPLNRSARAETLSYRLQRGAVGPDLRVAVHADLGGRNTGEGAIFDGCVAISAINAVVPDVVFVTERDWLLSWNSVFTDVGRAVQRRSGREGRDQKDDTAKDRQARNGVGAWMKYLGHRLKLSCWPGAHAQVRHPPKWQSQQLMV